MGMYSGASVGQADVIAGVLIQQDAASMEHAGTLEAKETAKPGKGLARHAPIDTLE